MLNFAGSFTVNFAWRRFESVLIVSESTHGRLMSFSLTLAGQVAQVMPGTLMTT